MNKPHGIAVDKSSNIYVADAFNNLIRKVSTVGRVSPIAGQTQSVATLDGPASSSYLFGPRGLTIE
ncbi:hypothetical protein [Pollutibacter soli]|uniref:hypothetical protein n=1 Tax=Pollutibacter soli TaxID=3034157 RepID=UPI003AF95CBE